MSTTLEFQGTIDIPAKHGVGGAAGCSPSGLSHQMQLALEPTITEIDEHACAGRTIDSTVDWIPLIETDQFEAVTFFALTIEEGGLPVELLIGHPPRLTGSAVFPTGFVGGETFEFELVDLSTFGGNVLFTVSVVFTAADQTAVQCTERINAAAALVGLDPIADVSNGQIVLNGIVPGADSAIEITDNQAAIGFPNEGVGLGTGYAFSVTSNAVLTPDEVPGEDFWVRGGSAHIDVVAAGS
jgi:hypothetical protein